MFCVLFIFDLTNARFAVMKRRCLSGIMRPSFENGISYEVSIEP